MCIISGFMVISSVVRRREFNARNHVSVFCLHCGQGQPVPGHDVEFLYLFRFHLLNDTDFMRFTVA